MRLCFFNTAITEVRAAAAERIMPSEEELAKLEKRRTVATSPEGEIFEIRPVRRGGVAG